MSDLLRRRDATQATFDVWKGRAFAFGTADCAKLVASHLKRMGHDIKLASVGSYTTALGGKRALRKLGYGSLAEAMDGHGFARIVPATALPGDVIELPGEPPFGALAVVLGNRRVIGFHEDVQGAEVLQPLQYIAAWRVDPWPR